MMANMQVNTLISSILKVHSKASTPWVALDRAAARPLNYQDASPIGRCVCQGEVKAAVVADLSRRR